MSDKGWIKLYRQIQDCSIWLTNEPFDWRSAWIDLLLSANHRDKQIIFNKKPLTIQRGQYLTSVRKLAERWHWSPNKTLRFLRMLEELKMVNRESDSSRTLLTIENYGNYQGIENSDEYSGEDTDGHTDEHTHESQTRIKELKNGKNIREVRHQHGRYQNVLLTDTDFEKLRNEFPYDYQDRIERLSEYMASSGRSYKSHLATIRNWARKDEQKPHEETYEEKLERFGREYEANRVHESDETD